MDEFGGPGAFEADPDVDLDEDMGQDVPDLDEYEAEGEEELDEHDDDDVGAGMPFDPIALGLKEINNLARCRVSTFKPGNGVKELLDDDLGQYWQYVSLSLPCPGLMVPWESGSLSPHSLSLPPPHISISSPPPTTLHRISADVSQDLTAFSPIS